ncbi:MAG: tetratricopeptide repeat protein [Candidatus Omnitrophica bacterium]|nr:tetratricopeptide repeat protein [Candidatus Omnitrophota bacterium]
MEKAISYYRQENYDEAIDILKELRQKDPTSTLAAYYLGLSYKQIEDYVKAKPQLEDAIKYTPKIKGALLELVEVLYQLGELDGAMENISIAEQEGIRPAQTSFLKGLVLLKQDRNLDAVKAFEKAKELDKSLTQTADYQIGLAYMRERMYAEAKDVFKEVIVVDPNSDTALFANLYMDSLKKRVEAERPFKFSLGVAYEYDDNVILMPSDASTVDIVADESDTREVVTFRGEYTKRFTDQLRLKANYSMYMANQDDLNEYDLFSNTVTVTPSYYFTKSSLSLPVSYNYTMVGGHDYLTTLSVTPLWNFMLGDSNMIQCFFRYQNKNFHKKAANDDERRDADNYAGGAGWFYFFAKNKGFLNLRYELARDDAEGRNWEQLSNKFSGTILVPLFDKLEVSTTGEIQFQDFENIHSVYGNEREDDVYTLSSMLTYDIFEDTEAQFRYTYINNESNLEVYDYDRHIFSGGVEYKF